MNNTIKLLPEITETFYKELISKDIEELAPEYKGHDEEWEWEQLTFNIFDDDIEMTLQDEIDMMTSIYSIPIQHDTISNRNFDIIEAHEDRFQDFDTNDDLPF